MPVWPPSWPRKLWKPSGTSKIRISTWSAKTVDLKNPARSGWAPPKTPFSVNAAWNSSTVRLPGFAAIVGAAPNPEIAKEIAEEYQRRNLYVFMCSKPGRHHIQRTVGRSRRPDRLEHPSGAFRSGHLSGRIRPWVSPTARPWPSAVSNPATTKSMLLYNKDRIFAFVNALRRSERRMGRQRGRLRQLGFPDPGRH